MNKLIKILPLFIFMMFIPFIVNAEKCEQDKITIESIEINNKSDNVTEKSESVINGGNIDLSLKMFEVGDSIEYKIIIKNDSSEDFEIDDNSNVVHNNYFNYTLISDNKSYVVKAKSSKEVLLKLEYKKEVPKEDFINGTYMESKRMLVNIFNRDNNINNEKVNPNTGVGNIMLLIVLVLSLSGFIIIFITKKKYSGLLMIVFSLMLIPFSVHALCKLELNINIKVQVDYLNSFFCLNSMEDGRDYYIPFRKGMKWTEFDDYIIDNYYKYKTYIMNQDGELKPYKSLLKFEKENNRLTNIHNYEYAEFVTPEYSTSTDILYDDFFAFGKSKIPNQAISYSYPNEFIPINDLETKYPEFYNEFVTNSDWWRCNINVFDYKYGCFYFNGS